MNLVEILNGSVVLYHAGSGACARRQGAGKARLSAGDRAHIPEHLLQLAGTSAALSQGLNNIAPKPVPGR